MAPAISPMRRNPPLPRKVPIFGSAARPRSFLRRSNRISAATFTPRSSSACRISGPLPARWRAIGTGRTIWFKAQFSEPSAPPLSSPRAPTSRAGSSPSCATSISASGAGTAISRFPSMRPISILTPPSRPSWRGWSSTSSAALSIRCPWSSARRSCSSAPTASAMRRRQRFAARPSAPSRAGYPEPGASSGKLMSAEG